MAGEQGEQENRSKKRKSEMSNNSSDESENKSNYKKKTDIPLTGQSIDKKVNPSKKVSDFY